MMITRESDYAIRIIRALKDEGELLPLEQICQRELVPETVCIQDTEKLERSGLVSIRRGAGGGCILNRSLADRPSWISLRRRTRNFSQSLPGQSIPVRLCRQF